MKFSRSTPSSHLPARPTAAQLQEQSAVLREEIIATLDELSRRASARHLRDAAVKGLRRHAEQLGDEVTGKVRDHPKTAAAVSVATGLLCAVAVRRWRRRRNAL